jgi:hypothetical protein
MKICHFRVDALAELFLKTQIKMDDLLLWAGGRGRYMDIRNLMRFNEIE